MKGKLPEGLGDVLKNSSPAVEEKQTAPQQKKPNQSKGRAPSASKPRERSTPEGRIKARELAEQKYGIEQKKPMTAAERQARRREEFVPFSVLLKPEQMAKLMAMAKEADTDLTNYVRSFIDNAPEPTPGTR